MSSIGMSVIKAERNAALSAFKEEFSSMSQSRPISKKKKTAVNMKRHIRLTLMLITRKKISLLGSLQRGIQQ